MWVFMLCVAFALSANAARQSDYGPDPWDRPAAHAAGPDPGSLLSADIHTPMQRKCPDSNQPSVGDWFFKRLLGIILKNGSFKIQEDGSREISITMKLPPEHWKLLEEYVGLDKPLTAEMFRRTVGYISDAIFTPSFTEKVVQAWSEYVLSYYHAYRDEITLALWIMAIVASVVLMSKYMSRRHIIIIVFIVAYLYEVFLSFKEFEKQEYDKLVSTLSRCSWRFWSSSCNVQMSDPLVFWKHMHPVKICIRMVAHFVTEPMLLVSSSVNQISDEITRDLVFPFSTIVRGSLVFVFNTLCILLIIMLVCTFVLNMPLNVGIAGLINFGIGRRQGGGGRIFNNGQPLDNNRPPAQPLQNPNEDRIGGENLQMLLRIVANQRQNDQNQVNVPPNEERQQNALPEGPFRRARHRANANDVRVLQRRPHSMGRIGEGAAANGFVL